MKNEMKTINGYTFDDHNWKIKGGGGQCNVATKAGETYFIKRLINPKYPESDNFKGKFRQEKIQECEKWLKTRKEIMRALPGSGTGTLVKPVEYFRDGPCYYETTHMVEPANIPYDRIWKESTKDKARIMLTVAMSLADVHRAGIVHGDLDPQNILISRSAGGNLVTRLIDFTDAFFEKDPPYSIFSKEFWWSPEVALYSNGSTANHDRFKSYISCKADVFSLGIIFHQYCSKDGQPPICSRPKPWQEFLDRKKPQVDPAIAPEFRELIGQMLEYDPASRPSMAEIHRTLLAVVRPISAPGGNTNVPDLSKDKKPDFPLPEHRTAPPELSPGKGKNSSGAGVSSVLSLNPRKVKICFDDGKEQIMDRKLAILLKYLHS